MKTFVSPRGKAVQPVETDGPHFVRTEVAGAT
jgi:hypothetical protein